MKFLRLLLRFAIGLIALGAILLAAAYSPLVQTWFVQRAINRQPGLRGTVGTVSAGVGKLDAADVHLEYDGAVLTLPLVKAVLPVAAAVWKGKFLIGSVVAKGWTLDLTQVQVTSAPKNPAGPASAHAASGTPWQAAVSDEARLLSAAIGGMLGRWNLPRDLSADGVDLEGDILVAGPQRSGSVTIHVTATGGGIAAGHEGVIVVKADGVGLDAGNLPVTVAGQASLAVVMATPRTVGRVSFKSELRITGGSLADTLTWSIALAADRASREATGSIDVAAGERQLANVRFQHAGASGELRGSWKVNVTDSDLPALVPQPIRSAFTATGEGTFEATPDLTRMHAAGRLAATFDHLGFLLPVFAGAGPVSLDSQFDLVHHGQTLRIGRLEVTVAGKRPVARIQTAQPIELDEATGRATIPDPAGNCAEIAVEGLPLDWLLAPNLGVTLAGSVATGGFAVRVDHDGFSLRPTVPLTAVGISIGKVGGVPFPGLDLSLSLRADWTADGWQIQWAPLTVASGGKTWATSMGQAARAGTAGKPVTVSATWSADLAALAGQTSFPGRRWIRGRSASGDFSAVAAGSIKAEGKFAVLGRSEKDALTGNVNVEFGPNRPFRIHAPLKLAIGTEVSDVSVEGSVIGRAAGSRIDLTLAGKSASLDQLRLLAAPLLAAADPGPGGPRAEAAGLAGSATPPRPLPFWGEWTGPVALDFDQLRVAGRTFDYVRATFDVGPNSIRLDHGLIQLVRDKMTTVDGTLSYEPALPVPYLLRATASLGEVDAAPLLSETPPKGDPVVTGRFTVAATLAAAGMNLDDLLGRTREEFRLTSHGGAFRLLKTNVGEALARPPDSSPAGDVLAKVGSTVEKFFGADRAGHNPGIIKLGPTTQAVLNFSFAIAEFSYDDLTLTAVRDPDGAISLEDVALKAADVHLTGSGRIGHTDGLALSAQPLTLDLQLGVRNDLAGLLGTGGLITASSRKDGLGYTLMEQPIHLSGTLAHIDDTRWRDLLAQAAERKPDPSGKTDAVPANGKR